MREEKDTERLNEMREREEKLIYACARLSMCVMKKEVMRRSRGMRGRRNLGKGRGREGDAKDEMTCSDWLIGMRGFLFSLLSFAALAKETFHLLLSALNRMCVDPS